MRKQYDKISYEKDGYKVTGFARRRDNGGLEIPTNLLMNGQPKIHKDNVHFYKMLEIDKPKKGWLK